MPLAGIDTYEHRIGRVQKNATAQFIPRQHLPRPHQAAQQLDLIRLVVCQREANGLPVFHGPTAYQERVSESGNFYGLFTSTYSL